MKYATKMRNVNPSIALLVISVLANLTVASNKKKTILLWYFSSNLKTWPFDDLGSGNSFFVKYKCKYQNCYVTSNLKRTARDKADTYDAILFSGGDSARMTERNFPSKRSYKQFYVFTTLDGADAKPVCQKYYDNFFNWTMTYRLNSDIPWTHFLIKQFDNKTVGPSTRVQWMNPREMIDLDQRTQARLNRKTKVAAWFVGDCRSKGGGKEKYVKMLSESLLRLSGQTVDIYGACGNKVCSETDLQRSNRMLDQDYVFYLAFENYHDTDYVTDKILTAFENFNVPVVLGGADYNRFAIPGSYLNAGKYSPYKLAGVMAFLHKKREKLYDFHKWRNYYYYVDNYDMVSGLCDLCAKLNKDKNPTVYKKFRQWWNPQYQRKCKRRNPKVKTLTKGTEKPENSTPKTVKEQSMFLRAVSIVSRPLGYLLGSIM